MATAADMHNRAPQLQHAVAMFQLEEQAAGAAEPPQVSAPESLGAVRPWGQLISSLQYAIMLHSGDD